MIANLFEVDLNQPIETKKIIRSLKKQKNLLHKNLNYFEEFDNQDGSIQYNVVHIVR